jgi:hypothetical protein
MSSRANQVQKFEVCWRGTLTTTKKSYQLTKTSRLVGWRRGGWVGELTRRARDAPGLAFVRLISVLTAWLASHLFVAVVIPGWTVHCKKGKDQKTKMNIIFLYLGTYKRIDGRWTELQSILPVFVWVRCSQLRSSSSSYKHCTHLENSRPRRIRHLGLGKWVEREMRSVTDLMIQRRAIVLLRSIFTSGALKVLERSLTVRCSRAEEHTLGCLNGT